MAQYEVSWSNIYDADSPEDAIRQAISDVTDPYSLATIWIARDDSGNRTVIDIAYLNDPYEVVR